MTPTRARDRATKLALTDTESALDAAQRIADPWFACQALAWVARFAPNERVEALALEALAVGRRHPDPYLAVGSAAWPVRALVETGRTDRLAPILGELLERAARVENPASRSEALFLVFQAVLPAGRTFWQDVFSALTAASDPSVHWRQCRNLRDAVLMVASEDPTMASEVVRRIADDRTRAKIERRFARGDKETPRLFFWNAGAQPGTATESSQ